MSTHASLNYEKNGTMISRYIHSDGYLRGLGLILNNYIGAAEIEKIDQISEGIHTLFMLSGNRKVLFTNEANLTVPLNNFCCALIEPSLHASFHNNKQECNYYFKDNQWSLQQSGLVYPLNLKLFFQYSQNCLSFASLQKEEHPEFIEQHSLLLKEILSYDPVQIKEFNEQVAKHIGTLQLQKNKEVSILLNYSVYTKEQNKAEQWAEKEMQKLSKLCQNKLEENLILDDVNHKPLSHKNKNKPL